MDKTFITNESPRLIIELRLVKLFEYYYTLYGTDETLELLKSLQEEIEQNRKPIIKGLDRWLNKL